MIQQKCYYTKFIPPCGDFVEDTGKITYLNLACTFDIETTSFYVGMDKCVTMYLWQFAITHNCACYGRTWSEFVEFLDVLEKHYNLNKRRKMIIYVHNLGFECDFIKSVIEINKMFANSPHKPMYFTHRYFIFKDSLILSGLSLRRTLEECKCPLEISKTELDYTIKRHSETPLTDSDLKYGLNDVLGLAFYIETEIEKNGNITKIPLTKTGYARRFVRERCFEDEEYKKKINSIQIKDEKVYKLLTQAFAGGYTHANPCFIGRVMNNVASIDFTSSYPSVMIRKKYPMSKFSQLNPDISYLDKLCDKYCCVFRCRLKKLSAKTFVHTISKSKCDICINPLEDNGRLVYADLIEICLTDVDYTDLKLFYDFEGLEILEFYKAEKEYLPKEFIECILELYENKTKLKGVQGKEDLYLVSKGILNSLYGMCVTSLIMQNYYIDDDFNWQQTEPKDVKTCLYRNAKNKRTFLIYAWGCWVTAWARHELFKGIDKMINSGDEISRAFGGDFIYSDTDSIKFRDYHLYLDWINQYNEECTNEINTCLTHYGIDTNRANPDGKHPLGVWDFECVYDKFKTLGCKRYMYTVNTWRFFENEIGNYCTTETPRRFHRITPIFTRQEFHITVAGLNKKEPVKYIVENGAFDFFNDDMKIPANYSGRLVHTHIKNQTPVFLYDYLGNKHLCTDKTGIFLEKSEYNLSLHDIFLKYLRGIIDTDTERIDTLLRGAINGNK